MKGISTQRWIAIAAALVFLSLNFALFRLVGEAEAYPQARRALAEFPARLDGWRCPERTRMRDEIERIARVNDYLLCNFEPHAGAEPEEYVNVYVGYHARQMRSHGTGVDDAETAIHPPKHCLPGAGYDIVESDTVVLELEGLPQSPARVNRLVIAKGERRELVYFWYQSRGRVIASDYLKVAYLAIDRVLMSRTDGSLVRFTTPIGSDPEGAEARLHALMGDLVPRLPAFLPD